MVFKVLAELDEHLGDVDTYCIGVRESAIAQGEISAKGIRFLSFYQKRSSCEE